MAAARKVVASVSGPTSDVAFRTEAEVAGSAAAAAGGGPVTFAAARAALQVAHEAVMGHFTALAAVESTAAAAGDMGTYEPTFDDKVDEEDDGLAPGELPLGIDAPARKAHRFGDLGDDHDDIDQV